MAMRLFVVRPRAGRPTGRRRVSSLSSRMLRLAALAIAFTLIVALPSASLRAAAAAQGETDAILARYRQQIVEEMRAQKIPGLSIAVVDDRQVLWAEGFGYTDWDRRQPVTPDTPFSIQSMSKSFTAVATLLAVQDGLLDLGAPVSEYLPDFSVHSIFEANPEQQMTLRHLLSCTAGFSHEAPVGNNFYLESGTFEEHVASISDTWLRFPVGQHYTYSNLGIDLAGYIVQVRAGKPFAQYVDERLLTPLGMASSSFDIAEIRANPLRAIGHESIYDELPLIAMMPCGGLYSSAADMARYLQFHMNKGVAGGTRLLSEELLETMYTPPFLAAYSDGYGLGIGVSQRNGARRLSHGGGGFGFLSEMVWYPELKLGAVLLTNSSGHNLQTRLLDNMLDEIIRSAPDLYREQAKTRARSGIDRPAGGVAPLSTGALAQRIEQLALEPDEAARTRWQAYTGLYRVSIWGRYTLLAQVRERDGRLYLDDRKLAEIEPGLFFTGDGEVVDLRGGEPTWHNIRADKVGAGSLALLLGTLGVCALILVSVLVVAPIRGLLRLRRRRQAQPMGGAARAAGILAVLAAVVGLLSLAGLSTVPFLVFGGWPVPTRNLPTGQQISLAVPFVGAALTVALIACTALAWRRSVPGGEGRRGWWLAGRAHEALAVVALATLFLILLF